MSSARLILENCVRLCSFVTRSSGISGNLLSVGKPNKGKRKANHSPLYSLLAQTKGQEKLQVFFLYCSIYARKIYKGPEGPNYHVIFEYQQILHIFLFVSTKICFGLQNPRQRVDLRIRQAENSLRSAKSQTTCGSVKVTKGKFTFLPSYLFLLALLRVERAQRQRAEFLGNQNCCRNLGHTSRLSRSYQHIRQARDSIELGKVSGNCSDLVRIY